MVSSEANVNKFIGDTESRLDRTDLKSDIYANTKLVRKQ